MYQLVEKRDGYELREYAAVAIASVEVVGAMRDATNRGFSQLFRYISTNQIAMTAPVVQTEHDQNKWQVEFIMPAGSRSEDLPAGGNTSVSIRQQPAELLAVVGFRGGIDDAKVQAKAARLRAALVQDGFAITGPLQVARFNPPFVPAPLRYNEIRIPVNCAKFID